MFAMSRNFFFISSERMMTRSPYRVRSNDKLCGEEWQMTARTTNIDFQTISNSLARDPPDPKLCVLRSSGNQENVG
jgi:hypothetical protein